MNNNKRFDILKFLNRYNKFYIGNIDYSLLDKFNNSYFYYETLFNNLINDIYEINNIQKYIFYQIINNKNTNIKDIMNSNFKSNYLIIFKKDYENYYKLYLKNKEHICNFNIKINCILNKLIIKIKNQQYFQNSLCKNIFIKSTPYINNLEIIFKFSNIYNLKHYIYIDYLPNLKNFKLINNPKGISYKNNNTNYLKSSKYNYELYNIIKNIINKSSIIRYNIEYNKLEYKDNFIKNLNFNKIINGCLIINEINIILDNIYIQKLILNQLTYIIFNNNIYIQELILNTYNNVIFNNNINIKNLIIQNNTTIKILDKKNKNKNININNFTIFINNRTSYKKLNKIVFQYFNINNLILNYENYNIFFKIHYKLKIKNTTNIKIKFINENIN